LKSIRVYQRKDLKITRMQDALTKKDSVTLALVTSKRTVGPMTQILKSMLKRSCIHSIADKLLFKSGSYTVTDKAKGVLAK
jgi:chemotaxis protein MotB